MKQGISLERKVGSGRPRLLNGQDTRCLLQLAVKDDMRTSTDLKLKLEKRESPNVSSRTITSYLNKPGYHYKTSKSEPLLTETHTVNRVQWCQDHIKQGGLIGYLVMRVNFNFIATEIEGGARNAKVAANQSLVHQ